jgi:putative holliday junction resolvase
VTSGREPVPTTARRVLGLDLGSKRIGVAVSDRSGTIAGPLTVLQRTGDPARDRLAVRRLVEEEEAEAVVVGLPLGLDGSVGRAAQAALIEAEALASVVGVPVATHDERFTTVSAERPMRAAGMKAPARRKVVDMVAAAVMLQAWLDGRSARP